MGSHGGLLSVATKSFVTIPGILDGIQCLSDSPYIPLGRTSFSYPSPFLKMPSFLVELLELHLRNEGLQFVKAQRPLFWTLCLIFMGGRFLVRSLLILLPILATIQRIRSLVLILWWRPGLFLFFLKHYLKFVRLLFPLPRGLTCFGSTFPSHSY